MLRELFARKREIPCHSVGPWSRSRSRSSAISARPARARSAGDGPPIVLLHGLSATRRNVVQGSRHLIKRGYRLIAYDARGHGSSSPAAELRVRRAGGRPRGRAGAAGARAGGAGGQLDGRRHGDGLHARAPRARARAGADHARLHGLRAHRRRGRVDLGGAGRQSSSAAASTPSSRWPSPTTSRATGARSPARPRASAWSATSTPTRWRRRCGRCRARSPGRASSRSSTSTCRC